MYSGMSPGIDHGAHMYGFVGGALFSYLFGPRLVFRKSDNRVIDRPLVPYVKPWKNIVALLASGDGEYKDSGNNDSNDSGGVGIYENGNGISSLSYEERRGRRGGGKFKPKRGGLGL